MKTLNAKYILDQNPTELKRVINQIGQEVVFYEHPTRGDDAPVLALVEGVVVKTDFFDTDDFYADSEYLPVLVGGVVDCAFGFENKDEYKKLVIKYQAKQIDERENQEK